MSYRKTLGPESWDSCFVSSSSFVFTCHHFNALIPRWTLRSEEYNSQEVSQMKDNIHSGSLRNYFSILSFRQMSITYPVFQSEMAYISTSETWQRAKRKRGRRIAQWLREQVLASDTQCPIPAQLLISWMTPVPHLLMITPASRWLYGLNELISVTHIEGSQHRLATIREKENRGVSAYTKVNLF